VIPRLLEYPSMLAVISEMRMETGYIAYPIAYFAERRPPVQDLSPSWARTNHAYTTQLGQDGWSISNDLWDFDLRKWVKVGKIRWCAPFSGNSTLSNDPAERFPYADLVAKPRRIIVRQSRIWRVGLPGGEPVRQLCN
jgi:hypothetical protein